MTDIDSIKKPLSTEEREDRINQFLIFPSHLRSVPHDHFLSKNLYSSSIWARLHKFHSSIHVSRRFWHTQTDAAAHRQTHCPDACFHAVNTAVAVCYGGFFSSITSAVRSLSERVKLSLGLARVDTVHTQVNELGKIWSDFVSVKQVIIISDTKHVFFHPWMCWFTFSTAHNSCFSPEWPGLVASGLVLVELEDVTVLQLSTPTITTSTTAAAAVWSL